MSYPATLDVFTAKVTDEIIADEHINDLQTAIAALEAKLGVTDSAVTTTVDYRLKVANGMGYTPSDVLVAPRTDTRLTINTKDRTVAGMRIYGGGQSGTADGFIHSSSRQSALYITHYIDGSSGLTGGGDDAVNIFLLRSGDMSGYDVNNGAENFEVSTLVTAVTAAPANAILSQELHTALAGANPPVIAGTAASLVFPKVVAAHYAAGITGNNTGTVTAMAALDVVQPGIATGQGTKNRIVQSIGVWATGATDYGWAGTIDEAYSILASQPQGGTTRAAIKAQGVVTIVNDPTTGQTARLDIGTSPITSQMVNIAGGNIYVQGGAGYFMDGTGKYYIDGTATNYLWMPDSNTAQIVMSSTARFHIDTSGNVMLGALAALATNATNGFAYMPTCAGTPSGTPTAKTGKVPWVYDTTNNIIYIYNGAWKKTAALT